MAEHQNSTSNTTSHHVPPPTPSFRPVRTGICHSQQMLKHWKPDAQWDTIKDLEDENDEPERPSRISSIMTQVSNAKLTPQLERIKIRQATKEEIMLVHTEEHWKRIEATATMSIQDLKNYFSGASLYVNADTFDCSRLSCGGVIEMCRAVMDGKVKNGFAVVRPPGHHSEPEEPSGFCFFNNAAISAKWLRTVYPDKVKKVLLVDWDVHHGNGIQRSFYQDASVLYISIHRFLKNNRKEYFYPGNNWGASNRVGEGAGQGFTVNIPWPEGGMCDADYMYAFQRLVMPIAMEFDPDFVLVSAGFDAAKNDPLGECDVTPAGFAHMTHMLKSLANGNIVLALEGGYHLESLAMSATACIKVLMGEAPPKLSCTMVASDVAIEAVDECLEIQSAFWKSLPQQGVAAKYELEMDGLSVSLGDVLKMHRSYDLYKAHGLCTIPSHDQQTSGLSKSYQNQIMVTDNVYDCKTLILFMHDLGNLPNGTFTESGNLKGENDALIAHNKVLMDWIRKNAYGLVDIQVLPSYLSDLAPGSVSKRAEQARTLRRVVNWIWNQFISLSDCQNLVLICLGEGCAALPVFFEIKDISAKLKASVHISSSRQPSLKLPSDCNWYRAISYGLLASTEEDRVKLGKHPCGKVSACHQSRPSEILRSEWEKIAEFVDTKLAKPGSTNLPSNGHQTDDINDISNNAPRGTLLNASNVNASSNLLPIPNATPNGIPSAFPMDVD